MADKGGSALGTQICLFVNASPPKLGGGAMSLLSLVGALPQWGWSGHVAVQDQGQLTRELERMDVPYTVLALDPVEFGRPIDSALSTAKWISVLRRIRPAIIHANAFGLQRAFALAAGMLRIPYVVHVRFPVSPEEARWGLRRLPKPAAVIFNSHAMRNSLWGVFAVGHRTVRAMQFTMPST